jgi:8-oxo-dGTP diphosphatase
MMSIAVAASLVRAPDGLVLLTERTSRQISPGFWEAPGGKVDPGETAEQAAVRELKEEVGITALSPRPWLTYVHVFPTRRIRLSWFLVDRWTGEPRGCEGQRIAWCDPADPAVSPILSSNRRALASLGVPSRYLSVTFDGVGGLEAFRVRVLRGLAAGARLVRLKLSAASPDQGVILARRVVELARAHGAQVLIAGSALEARRAGVAGIHTDARDLRGIAARPPTPIWAVTCRDRDDLERAAALGADIAVLASSPLPDWRRALALAAGARLPVYVTGDGGEAAIEEARRAGAAGLALGAFVSDGAAHAV